MSKYGIIIKTKSVKEGGIVAKKKIFMACGMKMPTDKELLENISKIAKHVADSGWTIANGGGYTGIMGYVVEEFAKYSNDIYMILPKKFKKDLPHLNFKELKVVEDEAGRLIDIKDQCETIVVLPGGSGTIEEFMYLVETKKYHEHDRDVLVYNYKGYFDDLFAQLNKCVKHGFLDEGSLKFEVAETVEELCALIDAAKAEWKD